MSTTIWHNPRCRKSRETLQLLQTNNVELDIFEYLNSEISHKELANIISDLGITPLELVRKNEAIYKENFKGGDFTDEEWIDIMIQNPKLIERPIVISSKGVRIGRPPEQVLEVL